MDKHDGDSCTNCSRPYRLKNHVMNYAWGTRGAQAFIPHLLGQEAEGDRPYAELWMGVHPNAPSSIISPGAGETPLQDWIRSSPEETLGNGDTLPYLLKVLSAGEALSIQAHPNKTQAVTLHKRDPGNYPDDNHKPEIAIAIDHLDALVGFISQTEYEQLLDLLPELREALHDKGEIPMLESGVRTLLQLRGSAPESIQQLNERVHRCLQDQTDLSSKDQLFMDLYAQYGKEDAGLLFVLLLQRVHLGPGQAVFLPPGIPHAYLKGNIIECMANSDNVVRLGLTPKFCDARALAEILDFKTQGPFLVETRNDGYQVEYLTPAKEFKISSLDLRPGESRGYGYHQGLTTVILLEGEISFHWCCGDQRCTSIFRRGNSFVIPAALGSYTLQARAHAKLILADIPDQV